MPGNGERLAIAPSNPPTNKPRRHESGAGAEFLPKIILAVEFAFGQIDQPTQMDGNDDHQNSNNNSVAD